MYYCYRSISRFSSIEKLVANHLSTGTPVIGFANHNVNYTFPSIMYYLDTNQVEQKQQKQQDAQTIHIYNDARLFVPMARQFFKNKINYAHRFHFMDYNFDDFNWVTYLRVQAVMAVRDSIIRVRMSKQLLPTLYKNLECNTEAQLRKLIHDINYQSALNGFSCQYQTMEELNGQVILDFICNTMKQEQVKSFYTTEYYYSNAQGQLQTESEFDSQGDKVGWTFLGPMFKKQLQA